MPTKSERPRPQVSAPSVPIEAQTATDELGDLVRAVATLEGHPTDKPLPEGIELNWRPELTAGALHEHVRERVREAMAQALPITRGRVFCYHCNEPDCRHSSERARRTMGSRVSRACRGPCWPRKVLRLAG